MITHLVKTPRGFIPASDLDKEVTDKIAMGEEAEVEFRKARNPRFHRKFFAMLHIVLMNQEKYSTLEDLLVEVKVRIGHYKESILSTGEIVYVPKSISFRKMNQLEFEKFYDKSVDAILAGRIVDITKENLELQVLDFT